MAIPLVFSSACTWKLIFKEIYIRGYIHSLCVKGTDIFRSEVVNLDFQTLLKANLDYHSINLIDNYKTN